MIRRLNGIFDSTPSFENSEELDRLSIPVRWRGHFTGWYGQCVEFVRRYLIQHRDVTFPSVRTAAELFERASEPWFFQSTSTSVSRPMRVIRVIRPQIPRTGDLIFLHYPDTSHVGIVVEFQRDTDEILIADQNYEYGGYWMGDEYAYSLPRTSPDIRGFVRLLPT